jgi:peroxiredoxin
MLPLGTPAPAFSLPDTEGNTVALEDFADASALVVAFICNHCPFVKHIQNALAAFAVDYQAKGLALVAINANDVETHPDDDPARMREVKAQVGYPFPYLYDESQAVAKAYGAACTPDFFLFDRDRRLVYRGRFDSSTPGKPDPVTGEDLRSAADAVLEGREIKARQWPSMGCNIKWKPGNEPGYAG